MNTEITPKIRKIKVKGVHIQTSVKQRAPLLIRFPAKLALSQRQPKSSPSLFSHTVIGKI